MTRMRADSWEMVEGRETLQIDAGAGEAETGRRSQDHFQRVTPPHTSANISFHLVY